MDLFHHNQQKHTGCANKNDLLEKRLYFSNGSTDVSQTFRLYM